MKPTFKTLCTTIALATAALLTGCAAPNMQATFTRGDEELYGRVYATWDETLELRETLCGGKLPKYKAYFYSPEFDEWAAQAGACQPEFQKRFNQVAVHIGVVNANGDGFHVGALYDKGITLEKGDIVVVRVYPAADGRFRRYGDLVRIAAKAKDATKANGCYWDAGTGVFAGFNQGGAVCEDWHWKNHPYSNPKMLNNK